MLPTGPPSSHALHSAGQGRPSEPNGWSREHASHAPRRAANSAANSTAPRGPGGWTAQQSEEILEEENVRLSDDLRHRTLGIQVAPSPRSKQNRGISREGDADGDVCRGVWNSSGWVARLKDCGSRSERSSSGGRAGSPTSQSK